MSARRKQRVAAAVLAAAVLGAGLSAATAWAAPAEGERLTLQAALQRADSRNPTLAATRQELAAADTQLTKAWASLLPSATLGAQYARADHADEVDLAGGFGEFMEGMGLPPTESEPTVVRRQDDLSASLSVSMPVVNLPAWVGIRLARQGERLAELTVEQARQQLLLATAQAHAMALTSERLVHMHETNLASTEEHLVAAKRRLDAGMGLELDVVRADTDVAQARQSLLDARLALASARDTLGLLVGTSVPPLPVESPPLSPPSLEETELVDAARLKRPDLRFQRASVELAGHQLDLARASLLPSIGLGWQGSYQITEPSDMGDSDRSRWTVALSLSVPLLSPTSYSEVTHKRVSLRQAELQSRAAQLEAEQAVRQARRDYVGAQSTVEVAARQAELAKRALGLTLAAYEAGAGSSLEVTDARSRATAAQVNLEATRLQEQVALVTLLSAVGQDLRAL